MKMNELFTFITYHFVLPDVYNVILCIEDLVVLCSCHAQHIVIGSTTKS